MVDRNKIAKYFTEFPMWAVWMIVIGVPFLFLKGLGLILIAIGIFVIYLDRKGRPTDQEMDAWFQEESKTFQVKALAKCGHDAADCVAEEVLIWGPRLYNRGNVPLLLKSGKDNVVRYNPLHLTILNFGADQLLCYQCSYDRTSGNFLNEATDEYFYKDVVSVSTNTQSGMKEFLVGKENKKVASKSQETFQLRTSGGTAIEICLSEEALLSEVKTGTMPTSQGEKAIQAVRRMLRDKKKT